MKHLFILYSVTPWDVKDSSVSPPFKIVYSTEHLFLNNSDLKNTTSEGIRGRAWKYSNCYFTTVFKTFSQCGQSGILNPLALKCSEF